MKITKKVPDKTSGTANSYSASPSISTRGSVPESARPANGLNDKGKRSQPSDRPSSPAKSMESAKKPKKKDFGGDEPWPFASITPQDLENEVRERAFFIFLQRGTEGDPLSDWLQAEAEIKRKYGIGI
jgi:hypothetical protein